MHPDQSTPPDHHTTSSVSQSEADVPKPPEISQEAEGDMEPEGESGVPAAAPEVEEGARVAEAGNAYIGRQLDDDLKANPRLEEGDEAVDEDPTTPGDE